MRIRQPELKRARIEIVPMIDTIFFLLVFFMITSLSMVNLNGKKVVLPESETAKTKPRQEVTVTVDKDQVFYVNHQKIGEVNVVGKLSDIVNEHPDTQVVVNCDKELPVTFVLKVFDYAKRANAAHVMIATSPRAVKTQ